MWVCSHLLQHSVSSSMNRNAAEILHTNTCIVLYCHLWLFLTLFFFFYFVSGFGIYLLFCFDFKGFWVCFFITTHFFFFSPHVSKPYLSGGDNRYKYIAFHRAMEIYIGWEFDLQQVLQVPLVFSNKYHLTSIEIRSKYHFKISNKKYKHPLKSIS